MLQITNIFERFAGGKFARGVNGLAQVGGAHGTKGVEVFHGQTERIHAVVAGGAQGVGAVGGEGLAHRGGVVCVFLGSFFERGDVGWRRGSGRAQNVFQNPFTALDRRGARGIRRDHHNTTHG